jgi:hypothetical protein
MTNKDPSREDDVPMHPGLAAYEVLLTRLERGLPSFARELGRVEARSMRGEMAYCDLS